MSKKVVSVNDKVPFLHGKLIEAKGIVPSGSIEITENDTYDVTQYAEAVVNVGGGSENDFDTPFVKYSVVDVTVGANTVGNAFDASKYFAAAVGGNLVSYSILSNPSIYNEAVLQDIWVNIKTTTATSSDTRRWRNGIAGSAFNNINYDTVLIEGTTYRCVFVETDVSDPQPY